MLRCSQRLVEQRPTTLPDLPHDVLVSIFEQIYYEDPRWVTETFPLVCRAWRDVYYSRQASPLHTDLNIDLHRDRAVNVLAWARRHVADVELLKFYDLPPGANIRDFTEATTAELVSVLGPHLLGFGIPEGCSSLMGDRFWATLRDAAVPTGKLEAILIYGIRAPIPDSFPASLGRLTNLKYFNRVCDEETREEAAQNDAAETRWGFSRFPESILALTQLKQLALVNHRGVDSVPTGISALRNLGEIYFQSCSLRSLPSELGALSGLTKLDVSGNRGLGGATDVEVAFPPALRGMQSLRVLNLGNCDLGAVPPFVGSLESLRELHLGDNDLGSAGAPHYGFPASFPALRALTKLILDDCDLTAVPPAVMSSMNGLKELEIAGNRLTGLPEDLGRRLPRLEKVDLQRNNFMAFPLAALAGATSLQEIDISGNEHLQIEESLDSLLQTLPRLRKISMGKESGSWSNRSMARLFEFSSRLQARSPAVEVVFEEEVP